MTMVTWQSRWRIFRCLGAFLCVVAIITSFLEFLTVGVACLAIGVIFTLLSIISAWQMAVCAHFYTMLLSRRNYVYETIQEDVDGLTGNWDELRKFKELTKTLIAFNEAEDADRKAKGR